MASSQQLENKIYNSWPYVEAQKLLDRFAKEPPAKGYVLFETGYGPSGLPHIGTFGEVVRTMMVMRAFQELSSIPAELMCFSDDMDGMRKIPDTIPANFDLRPYMDLPLTSVPDPFGTSESFGHNMNAKLRSFLDGFGFKYKFSSATEYYKNGLFNQALLRILECYDQIMNIMLPTLGPDRRQTYSPILPICPKTGKVLQVPLKSYDINKGTVVYADPATGELMETDILNGGCKAQWKVDIAMRWYALKVDFEMYGKDHLVNGPIYSRICEVLGGKAPNQMFYELFLDEDGKKISKSKGNGLTIEEWLKYAPRETLALFMYVNPQRAKKLHHSVIPKCVDEYLSHVRQLKENDDGEGNHNNPAIHVHKALDGDILIRDGHVPEISYALLINLISACDTDKGQIIIDYLEKNGIATEGNFFRSMLEGALRYYHHYIKGYKKYKIPGEIEKLALAKLSAVLQQYLESSQKPAAEEIQGHLYDIAREFSIEPKEWFLSLYAILLGGESGPRFGSFISLYGLKETIELIQHACRGRDESEQDR